MGELIGRFHPLVVHLPIGFILMGFLLESYVLWRKDNGGLKEAVKWAYLASAIAGVIAVVTGLVLSDHGKFIPATLAWHKWLAISTMVLAAVLYLDKTIRFTRSERRSWFLSLFLVALVSVTGHFGGMLTHGHDYLVEKAPEWMKQLAGYEPALASLENTPPDSVVIYRDLIKPVLGEKCAGCHNAATPEGGLDLTSFAALMRGGENGMVIKPGHPMESELVRRISLPVENERFMPPGGKVISQAEYAILNYWIEQKADSALRFTGEELPIALSYLLNRDYGLDYTPRPHYEKLRADSLAADDLEALEEAGFRVSFLGEQNFFLDVQFPGDTLQPGTFAALEPVAGQVVFLDLSNSFLVDSTMSGIENFDHLSRLDVRGTNFGDPAAVQLSGLPFLETLNAFRTRLTTAGLEQALANRALKKVYLWQTRVTRAELTSLRARYPERQFIGGSTLQIHADTTRAGEE